MCHQPIKFSDTFLTKIPLVLLTKLGKTHSDEKGSHGLALRAKIKVIAKITRCNYLPEAGSVAPP